MAGGWDGVKLVLLFTSHSTIFKWFGTFFLALESSSAWFHIWQGWIQDFLIAKGSILQSRWGFDLFIVPDYLLFFPEFSEMSMKFE